MRPICVPCGRFFFPKKNGIAFVENMNKSGQQTPYKLWLGDSWECRGCGASIIVGAGTTAVSEHYMEDFAQKMNSYNPKVFVNGA